MRLTYWCATNLADSKVYSIRARTRKEARAVLSEQDSEDYTEVRKVTVEYRDGFDLLMECLGGGGYWEPDE